MREEMGGYERRGPTASVRMANTKNKNNMAATARVAQGTHIYIAVLAMMQHNVASLARDGNISPE